MPRNGVGREPQFNALPQAPVCFVAGPGQAGACGWALNNIEASQAMVLFRRWPQRTEQQRKPERTSMNVLTSASLDADVPASTGVADCLIELPVGQKVRDAGGAASDVSDERNSASVIRAFRLVS